MTKRNALAATIWLSLATGASVMGGCSTAETHSYPSTPHMPQTVSLINTATGETIWTCDIPVGKKLDIRFEKRADVAEEQNTDTMTWSISGVATTATGRRNSLKVPPPSHRLLKVTERAAPEVPR